MERSNSLNYRFNKSRNKSLCGNKNFQNITPLNITKTFNSEIKNNSEFIYKNENIFSANIPSLKHSRINIITDKIKSFNSNTKKNNNIYFTINNKIIQKNNIIKPLYSKYNIFNDYGIKNEFMDKESNLVKIKGEFINDKDKALYIDLMKKFRKKYGLRGKFYVSRNHKKLDSNEKKFEWTNCFLTYDQLKEIKNKRKENKKYDIHFLDQKGIERKIKVFKYNRYDNNFTKAFSITNYSIPKKNIYNKNLP